MRAENLAILDERYENAYIHGDQVDQEEMWAVQDTAICKYVFIDECFRSCSE